MEHTRRAVATLKSSRAEKVTLADVAALAGCSLSVASKTLSGRPYVSEEMRTRVFKAAEELGYRRQARSSDPVRRRAIVAAFDGFGSPYSAELFAGALRATTRSGVELLAASLPYGTEGPVSRAWLDAQIASGISGAFLVTSELRPALVSAARESAFSLVAVDPKAQLKDEVVTVGATNFVGTVSGTRHLMELGHTRIAFVGRRPGVVFSMERLAGYSSALAGAGIDVDERWVFDGETEFLYGLDAGVRIARMPVRPTAVVCVCDEVAFGVMEGARREGLRIPDDLSVVGFDDLPYAQWSSPQLTTVRQPLRKMGEIAVRTLLRLMQGREPDTFTVQMRTALQVRGTTAPPQREDPEGIALVTARV